VTVQTSSETPVHILVLTTGNPMLEAALLGRGHQVTLLVPDDIVAEQQERWPGLAVHGTPTWEDPDGRELERLLAELPDGIDAVETGDEQCVLYAARLRERLGGKGLTVEQAVWMTDKARMLTQLADKGLPVAWHRVITHDSQVEWAVEQLGGLPLIFKPTRGMGSTHTYLARTPGELQELRRNKVFSTALADSVGQFGASRLLSPLNDQGGFLAQRYIQTTVEYFVDFLIVDGKPFPMPGRYSVPLLTGAGRSWHWTALPADHPEMRAVVDLAQRALDAMGHTHGAAQVEILRDHYGRLWVGEVAARLGGGVPDAYGRLFNFDVADTLAKVLTGEDPSLDQVEPVHRAVTVLGIAPPQGLVTAMSKPDTLLHWPEVLWVDVRLALGRPVPPQFGSVPGAGRVSFVPDATDNDSIDAQACALLAALGIEVASIEPV
jgi:glutathione synthase/RimK-type ligase-like ATP-grasp enzyme